MLQLFLKVNRLRLVQLHKAEFCSNQKASSKISIFQLLKFVKEEKYRLYGAVGLLFISSGVTLTVPLIIGKLIDFISTGKMPNENVLKILRSFNFKSVKSDNSKNDLLFHQDDIKKFGILSLGFFIIGGLANFGRFYLIQTTGQRLIIKLRNNLYKSLIRKPIEFFDRNKSGELISRMTVDAAIVGEGLSNNISNGLRSSLQTGLGITMMLYVSPQLSLFSMFILPPVTVLVMIFGRQMKKISNNLQNTIAISTEKANESLSAVRTVKAFNRETKEIDDFMSTTSNVLKNAYRDALIRGSFYGIAGMSGNILTVSLLIYGGSLISSGQLTLGELSSFLLYAAYATVSIGGIGTFYTELMKASGAGSRLWEWLYDGSKSTEKSVNQNLPHFNNSISLGDIKFENVIFTYPTRPDQTILDNFSLSIPHGKLTAIIGPSGCGKSSIVSLLLKFYQINSGNLLINDVPLSEIDSYEWRKRIAVVMQDPVLFSCSIAENIAYGAKANGDKNFKLSDVEKVARQAQVMEFVSDLSEGFDTKIGERGVLLSGGQRQRIAIARALMSNPDIVILDEAMSALDNENEKLVQQAIHEIFRGRTVVTISHRLAFLRSAHQIAVINKGKVLQLGSFEELLNDYTDNQNQNIFKNLLNNIS